MFHLLFTKTYTYTWKTDKNWRNTCRVFRLGLADRTTHDVNIRFLK